MNVKLRVWRQRNARTPGRFETYEAKDINPEHVVPGNARCRQ